MSAKACMFHAEPYLYNACHISFTRYITNLICFYLKTFNIETCFHNKTCVSINIVFTVAGSWVGTGLAIQSVYVFIDGQHSNRRKLLIFILHKTLWEQILLPFKENNYKCLALTKKSTGWYKYLIIQIMCQGKTFRAWQLLFLGSTSILFSGKSLAPWSLGLH